MKLIRARLLDHGLAFFTILIWGITFINTKVLGEHFTAMEILFIRYAIAYIVLWFMCPKILKFHSVKEELLFFAAGMTGATAYQYLENLSVMYTSPASVSFITAMAPIFTAIFAHLFLKEEFNAKILCGMMIALAGVFLVTFGDSKTIRTGLLGDLIIFFSVWLWAIYSIIVKKIAAYGYSGFLVTRRIFFYALLIMIPIMIPKMSSIDTTALLSVSGVGNFLYLGVFASAVCFATWNRSVDKLGATTTSKYLFVMPVITLVGQMIYNKSAIGIFAVFGMVLILIGLLVTDFDFSIFKKRK